MPFSTSSLKRCSRLVEDLAGCSSCCYACSSLVRSSRPRTASSPFFDDDAAPLRHEQRRVAPKKSDVRRGRSVGMASAEAIVSYVGAGLTVAVIAAAYAHLASESVRDRLQLRRVRRRAERARLTAVEAAEDDEKFSPARIQADVRVMLGLVERSWATSDWSVFGVRPDAEVLGAGRAGSNASTAKGSGSKRSVGSTFSASSIGRVLRETARKCG